MWENKKNDYHYNNGCFDIEEYIELDVKIEKANLSIFSHPDINNIIILKEMGKKKQGKGRVLKVCY